MKINILLLLLAISFTSYSQAVPKGYKKIYAQSFDTESSLKQFRFTQPDKWLLSGGHSGNALEFTGISDGYEPPFRSPYTIGLIGNLTAGSFILEADLQQTGKEYGHRDMCIIFGFRDPSHFYYTHIASKMDDHAHQIMIVNNAPRTKISTFTTGGVDWGNDEWHHVRVERDAELGSIKVFFDGELVEEANDKTFTQGYFGFGSFDDSGKIDNINIRAKDASKKTVAFFNSKE